MSTFFLGENMSIFIENNEDIIKSELNSNDYYASIETSLNIKELDINENLEMLAYDVADAIFERQILLIESDDNNTEAYLIPIIHAYQNSKTFKHFIIATSSNEKVLQIKEKLEKLSQLLSITIPTHYLLSEDNYLCLRRLQKRVKRHEGDVYDTMQINSTLKPSRIQRKDWEEINDKEWSKVHVNHCTTNTCQFFQHCRYVIQYYNLLNNGATIITHGDLIGNKRYDQITNIAKNNNLIIVDDAKEFANNIRKKYENNINFEVIIRYLFTANRNLANHHIYLLNDETINSIRIFFQVCYQQYMNGEFKFTDELCEMAKQIRNFLTKLSLELTRVEKYPYGYDSFLNIICDALEVMKSFFDDISNRGLKYHYKYEPKNSSDPTDKIKNFKITYTPIHVDEIIRQTMEQFNSSIIMTGDKITEKDNEYQTLCSECGLHNTKKMLIKEFSVQKKS